MTTETVSYERFDAVVKHNLTMREQLKNATKDNLHGRMQAQKHRAMIEALVSLLSQTGWKVGATGNATRLMLDTKVIRVGLDPVTKGFVTISAEATGRRWNVHAREDGTEYTVAQAHFDYIGPTDN